MAGNRRSYGSSWWPIFLDVWALHQHIAILELELPRLIDQERKRIWQDVKAGDEYAEYHAGIAEYYLDEGITTRLLTGTALIVTWATYESAVARSAKQIQQSMNVETKPWGKNKRGPFPDKAKRYFEDFLELDLHPPGTDWDRIRVLYDLRNTLAHANGQLEDVRPEALQKRVEKWASSFQGLKVSDGYLIVSIEFVRRAFDFIERLLMDLGQRADGEVRPKP